MATVARACGRSSTMSASSEGLLFAFLEADLAPQVTVASPEAEKDADPVWRALELATPEWSEQEAGAEMALLWDRETLRAAQTRLVAALHRCPFVHRRGIRAARILW